MVEFLQLVVKGNSLTFDLQKNAMNGNQIYESIKSSQYRINHCLTQSRYERSVPQKQKGNAGTDVI